jgi:hypothetical protein
MNTEVYQPVDGVPPKYWDFAKNFLGLDKQTKDEQPSEWSEWLYRTGQLKGFVPVNGVPIKYMKRRENGASFHEAMLPYSAIKEIEMNEEDQLLEEIEWKYTKIELVKMAMVCATVVWIGFIVARAAHII